MWVQKEKTKKTLISKSLMTLLMTIECPCRRNWIPTRSIAFDSLASPNSKNRRKVFLQEVGELVNDGVLFN